MKPIVCIGIYVKNLINHQLRIDLIDSILQMYSVKLSLSEINTASNQLKGYLNRFRTVLKSAHALNLKRLILFIGSLAAYVTDMKPPKNRGDNNITKPSDLIHSISVTAFVEKLSDSINGVNLVELKNYLASSKVN